MPVVLRYKGFRFFFYSNEGSPREPVAVASDNRELIERAWNDYFG